MSLIKRKNAYYLVYNVPVKKQLELKKKQIWISLKTLDKHVALERYCMLIFSLNRGTFNTIRETTMLDAGFELTKIALKTLGNDKTSDYSKNTLEQIALSWLRNKISLEIKNDAGEPIFLSKYFAQYMQLFIDYKGRRYKDASDILSDYFKQENFPIPSEQNLPLAREVFMRALLQFNLYMMNYCRNTSTPIPNEILAVLPEENQDLLIGGTLNMENTQQTNLQQEVNAKPTKIGKTFYDVALEYNNFKDRPTKKSMVKMIEQKSRVMNELLGDIDITEISLEYFEKKVADQIIWIHKSYAYNHSKELTIDDFINLGKQSPSECSPEDTLAKYKTCTKAVLGFAKLRDYIPDNFYEAINWKPANNKQKSEKYKPFNPEQIEIMIHEPPIYTKKSMGESTLSYKDSRHWIPLISLFTGCRLTEICQLFTSDIKNENGIYYFDINMLDDTDDDADITIDTIKSLKTKNATRLIPIHEYLLRMGIIEYVNEVKNKNKGKDFPESHLLFPELLYHAQTGEKRAPNCSLSDPTSKWFARYLDYLNKNIINNDSDKFVKKQVAHSFRHTVNTEYNKNNMIQQNKDYVESLMGWDKGSSMAYHYGKDDLKKLQDVVNNGIKYDGIDFSHLFIK